MYSKIIVIGNLGADPDMRYNPDGTPVTHFSVAANRKWTGSDGEQHEQTTWFRVTVWRRMAEVCNQYLSKGRLVMVEGELQPDENGGPRIWFGNDGEPRASYELTAQTVKFLGGRNGAPRGGGLPSQDQDELPFPEEEEEIPF